MTAKLWSKGYDILPALEHYGAARNAALDGALARHDVWGSLAHARTLHRAGLLTDEEWRALDEGLRGLLSQAPPATPGSLQSAACFQEKAGQLAVVRRADGAESGGLTPTPGDEDIHTLVERLLVERIGAAGKKLHTGRSRNDQVLVDLRLYAKEALLDVAARLLDTAARLVTLARAHEWMPMPGYTHMQRGMLSSVGLWAAAHAEALLDDCVVLAGAYALNDQCPLGSAAAYGVPLPLDRAYTAAALGFAGPHHNVLAAANSRGKTEAATVQALALVMLDLSKLAQDVLLFTTSEFAFFSVPAELCDGSSIMPQKRNLSPLELVRARAHTVVALQGQMLATLVGLPSGYNMDFQETKAPLLEAVAICRESLDIVGVYVEHLAPDRERLFAACTAELFATDRAHALAQAGMPFRDAYRAVAADPAAQEPGDLVARLRARSSIGTPGNLELDAVVVRITAERAAWQARQGTFNSALNALVSGTAEDDVQTSEAGRSGAGGFALETQIVVGI